MSGSREGVDNYQWRMEPAKGKNAIERARVRVDNSRSGGDQTDRGERGSGVQFTDMNNTTSAEAN